jgi:hypothetical protein
MKYFCCDIRRLEVIKRSGTANAIEYLEVRDHLEPDPALRQRTLFVRFVRRPRNAAGELLLKAENVLIDGGERLARVPVEWIATADQLPPGVDVGVEADTEGLRNTLVIRTAVFGDFSRYTLHLRSASGSDEPPEGFDPKLSEIDFSFKVECPSDFDCAVSTPCPPEVAVQPDIDYLAKDYTGFRRLMLDRLSQLTPEWSERSAADVGVTLVELLAYAADNLSYRQDAIANEAYLSTARKRVSVRRHARLVDYALHDGCNARAWVHVDVATDRTLHKRTAMLTRSGDLPRTLAPASKDWRDALADGAIVFETAHEARLFKDHNKLSFYTWGDEACCLPRGTTRATLEGSHPDLAAGHVLVFNEAKSPTHFNDEDADRGKRWAVRLTEVKPGVDPSGKLFAEQPTNAPLDITEIAWDAVDALPFPLCLSVKERPGLEISIAVGNIVLVDHGQTVHDESLGSVPVSQLRTVPAATNAQACGPAERKAVPARFRPVLSSAPVTQGFDLETELAIPLATGEENDEGWWPASALITRDPHEALPAIAPVKGELELDDVPAPVISEWFVQRDLLASDREDPHFVAEAENDGTMLLRFGDDAHGQRPNEKTKFTATYRVGNGVAGNVGAEAIFHIVGDPANGLDNVTVSNPMSAAGGVDPEDIEAARRDAPEAFRTQERAVTAADYAAAAEQRAEVQRAAATFRWTGSWHTVFVTADRFGGAAVDPRFETRLRRHLERFRMAGYDLEVDAPRYVALDIALHICVLRGHVRSHVLRALQAELGSGVLPDKRLAVFHPDNFSFGEPVYLSRIVAAAQAIEGVEAVWPLKFERMAAPDAASLDSGVIRIGRLEIAQLANNPNFRERGRLMLETGGGR